MEGINRNFFLIYEPDFNELWNGSHYQTQLMSLDAE